MLKYLKKWFMNYNNHLSITTSQLDFFFVKTIDQIVFTEHQPSNVCFFKVCLVFLIFCDNNFGRIKQTEIIDVF